MDLQTLLDQAGSRSTSQRSMTAASISFVRGVVIGTNLRTSAGLAIHLN